MEKDLEINRLVPALRNVTALGSFLGTVKCYNKFVPNFSTVAAVSYSFRVKK